MAKMNRDAFMTCYSMRKKQVSSSHSKSEMASSLLPQGRFWGCFDALVGVGLYRLYQLN